MKNTFFISCPIDTYSGYGARSRDFVKALVESDKYIVRILSQRWGNTPFGFIKDHKEEWGFLEDLIIPNQIPKQPDIWCQITVPNEFQPVGKYNIGLTAGIETTACAPQWIEGCNKMNLVLTSSEHSKRVFENSIYTAKDQRTGQEREVKLTTPVKVLIEGANLDVYKPISTKDITSTDLLENINSIKESFAYLFVGHWMQGQLGEDRKNVGLTIKAFYETFKNKKNPPALILKTSSAGACYMDRWEIQKRIDSIRNTVQASTLPSVYLLHGEFSNQEMNELYNHPKVKAMVSLTKGEGFGRPLLEFSLTNKPIMTTGWSGHVDFLKPEFTALMQGKLDNVHPTAVVKDMILQESQWFNVDHGHVGHFFNDIFTNYKDWKVKSKRQGYYSRTNFSFNEMVKQIETILSKNLPEFPQEVKLKLPKIKKIELPKNPTLKKV
jgi:hypothetical protein